MRKFILTMIFLGLVSAVEAAPRNTLGAGVMAGDPTGFNVKYWITDIWALDGGVGLRDDTVFYGGLMATNWSAFRQPKEGRLGLYGGVGPRVIIVKGDNVAGIRTFAGVTLLSFPFEMYAGGGPVFDLEPDTDMDLDISVGLRFYFETLY